MPVADLQELLVFAHALADIAAVETLAHFRANATVDDKGHGIDGAFDPVTAADRGAEREIVARIRASYPGHAIVGEEFGIQGGAGPLTWVLDPVDGTRAFICGAPTWGTLIGLRDGDTPQLGLMDQPHIGERFWGSAAGAFMRGRNGSPRPISTSRRRTLAEAYLSSTSPHAFAEDEEEAFARVRARARAVRYGLDCYAYCLLAMGTIDVVVEAGLKPYDILALVPIIEAAGGCVTTWDGGSPIHGGRIVASANQMLHAEALTALEKTG